MSKYLEIYWAKTHNLKNITVKIPKNKITVITGVSWSGKTSLAFNTIYNVGQQKYLESLSSYARMFVWKMSEEAEVEEIKWLSPTISIDQKTTSKNPRSTVWTITEIYDYYKLMYLNIWKRKCVKCKNMVKKDSIDDIIDYLLPLKNDTKFIIKAPIKWNFLNFEELKKEVLNIWFIRFSIWKKIYTINDEIDTPPQPSPFRRGSKNHAPLLEGEGLGGEVYIIIDRLTKQDYKDQNSSNTKRLKDSLSLWFKIWKWLLNIEILEKEEKSFSNIFICSDCWHIPIPLSISNFSFNSHAWACTKCHWLWIKKIFLEDKITNPNLTLLEWAVIASWFWWNYFFALIKEVWEQNDINLNKKYKLLTKKEKDIVLYWTKNKIYKVKFVNEYWESKIYNSKFEWVINTLERRYFNSETERWVYDDYIMDIHCPACKWYRLNKESLSVYLKWLNIWELSDLSIDKAIKFFKDFKLTTGEQKISQKVLKNIIERLEFLSWVWLDYISISRKAWTLSGWESQRIRLATQIWTKLEWIIYILDEPSIWLHSKDNNLLISNLKKLRDIWNTLIVVEHDEDIMRESDYIIDIWPWAWIHWWEIVAKWNIEEIISNKNSITWPYLNGSKNSPLNPFPSKKWKTRRKNFTKFLEIVWAKENNLKNLQVKIPLWNFVVITWVSWSWKSSLVNDILANYLANNLNRAKRKIWLVDRINWLEYLDKVVIIDQSPIWKTPKSNPATYTQVFTPIREVFAMTQEAQIRWYWPGRFSFNTKIWRCNECDWNWLKKIEMHFLPPVYVECESCNWSRYNRETLQIKYRWKTISDVLNMTVEEAIDFFINHPRIIKILKTLFSVWLGYIKLWQSSTTLSGWEAQRVKLSTELSKRSTWKTFYILDEPTTGLHFQDVEKLLTILHSLVDKWNSVLVIEHNMDIIINSDYIIDIWPEWWDKWWEIVFTWTIEDMKNCKNNHTAEAVNKYFNKN